MDSIFGKGPTILNRLRSGLDQLDILRPGRLSIIDCCPYIGVLALNAIFACELILIPVSTDYLSLQAADQITRTLSVLEPVLKRRVERRYLLTRFDRRRRAERGYPFPPRDRFGSRSRPPSFRKTSPSRKALPAIGIFSVITPPAPARRIIPRSGRS